MREIDERDVVVIGGGPAGSTVATLLAGAGYDVVLLEKERFPRDHVGESLLPFCYSLMVDLGVAEEFKRRFVRKPGVRFVDPTGLISTTWCFEHVIKDESHLSFQVIRSEFDHILLNNARSSGVDVREQTRAVEFDIDSTPEAVTVVAASGSEKKTIRARFLVDASGRDSLLGSRKRWRTARTDLDRTALWSHWDGVRMAGGLEEGLSIIIYIGERKKGWLWVFPLGPTRITAGFVAQNEYIREQQRALQGSPGGWQQTLLTRELCASPFMAELLAKARQVLPAFTNGNYSYEVKNHYGSNYAIIGDARGFLDPIFSSGVFLSMKTAFLVAEALIEKLRLGHVGVTDGMLRAYDLVNGAYDLVHRMIRLFYNPHTVSWAEFGAESGIHRSHESAMAAGHFMLAGDFFENHDRYNRFFRFLENPHTFSHYKSYVLDRPELNESSCSTSFETAFGQMLEADERRRSDDGR